MMSLTFGLFTQVSGSGPLGPLVNIFVVIEMQPPENVGKPGKSLKTS